MLMMRLQRLGRKHDPSYRVVVTEKTSGPKAGKFVEDLGHYDARLGKGLGKDLTINTERAKYWLGVGATASGTLHNLLVREGIVKGKKRDVRPAKVVVKETAQTPQTEQTALTMSETEQAPNEEVKTEAVKEEVASETAPA
ncbi:MAG TPA: 30S ribosomal protein S16 [Candidatus Paceibacterota bacterium]